MEDCTQIPLWISDKTFDKNKDVDNNSDKKVGVDKTSDKNKDVETTLDK